MPVIEIETERVLLVPVRHSDARDIERFIFAEPEIVKALAHDGSRAERRRYHAEQWSGFGPDGGHEFWAACQMGLYVIRDRSGSIATADTFLGVCGVFLELEQDKWCGELFYALASPFHGKGVMSEAAAAVLQHFDQLPNAGYLYAVYWQLLNPASGRVLQKLGFKQAGTRNLLDEYPQELYQGIRDFELWRLNRKRPDQHPDTLREVAIKLGHLEREGIGDRQRNLHAIQQAIALDDVSDRVVSWMDEGLANPGFGLLKYHPRSQSGNPSHAGGMAG